MISFTASCNITAQHSFYQGQVLESLRNQPLAGATVIVYPGAKTEMTDQSGRYFFPAQGQPDSLLVSAVGYSAVTVKPGRNNNAAVVRLQPHETMLADVVITAAHPDPCKAIGDIDIKMRGISNAQEVLRIVPGLFIGQHQGGGKAEQIFLRGFDNDHGTDINMSADGMPINLVSHAHGQGYADSHFIIPETIQGTTYQKGPYDAAKGDLAVSGSVDYHTADRIDKDLVQVAAGQFNSYRVLAMMNLSPSREEQTGKSWYAATEYRYSDGYFDNPQHFTRFNFFTKFTSPVGPKSRLSLSASGLYSKWNASGQIPLSAVNEGIVGFYGALDPLEGGLTARVNLNAQLTTTLSKGSYLSNQLYYSRYSFDLHSNFTFFLTDTLNGDEIRQRESRDLLGYNGHYQTTIYLGSIKLTSEAGLNARLDLTHNSELAHTVDRYTLLNDIKRGDINESGTGAYLKETIRLSRKFTAVAGLRFDHFNYVYHNKLPSDSSFSGTGRYRAANQIFSPKLSLRYQVNPQWQLYALLGRGFHSNDARSVVALKGVSSLPAAYGADGGVVWKPLPVLLVQSAIWYSYLQHEYVYGGDGGTIEFSGPTRRTGFDLSVRYQPWKSVYLDADLNYAHGRSVDASKGDDYIPLAPVFSSTGGITWISKKGFNGSFRYRHLGDRPANENNSLTAKGYFVNDLVVNYTKSKYEIGITVNNLFDVKWRETQFDTETRLKGGTASDGIAFTAGTKFAAMLHLSVFFR